MGAYSFTTFQQGADLDKAFRDACERARYEHGHGGYTGTIAEKGDYVVIAGDGGEVGFRPIPLNSSRGWSVVKWNETAPVDLATAQATAERLMQEDDDRINDKWGPAGAIRVKGGTFRVPLAKSYRTDVRGRPLTEEDRRIRDAPSDVEVERDGWLFFGWASS